MYRKIFILWTSVCLICAGSDSARASHDNQLPAFNALSAEADPHSGSAVMSVPIGVPAGRAGIQPNLALVYSSNVRNGMLGVGWTFEVGAIQRSTKKGTPQYDETDTFIFIQGGGAQELIATGGSSYRTEIEGAFLRIEKLNGSSGIYWLATDKKGTQYTFGGDEGAYEYDSGRIFRWCLNRVEDIHGNYMEIHYWRDGNSLYPLDIVYTAFKPAAQLPHAKVGFVYEGRPDTVVNYSAGFQRSMTQRLTKIDVYADSEMQRRCVLDYGALSGRTERSLVRTITTYGDDGISALPPAGLAYQDTGEPVYTLQTVNTNSITGDNLWNVRYAGGYDRGGSNYGPVEPPKFDVTWSATQTAPSGSNGNITWSISSNGDLYFSANKDSAYWFWTYLYVNSAKTLYPPYTTQGVDGMWLNGNYDNHVGGTWALNQGYNLVEMTFYNQNQGFDFRLNYNLAGNVDLMNSSPIYPAQQFFGDGNGDGLSDMVYYTQADGRIEVTLSDGTSFGPKTLWADMSWPTHDKHQVLAGDFNGDGKTDIASFDGNTGNWRAGLSTGSALADSGQWISGFGNSSQPSTGDFNADGLTDIVYFWNNSGGALQAQIALSTGSAFTSVSGAAPVVSDSNGTGIGGDFNADGLADLGVWQQNSGLWEIRLNPGDIKAAFPQMFQQSGFGSGRHNVIADFNSDGMTDIGYYENTSGSIICKLSTGSSFGADQSIPAGFTLTNSSVYVQAADTNGDGLPDYAAMSPFSQTQLASSSGEAPDLMASIDNGIGGTTALTYVPSTRFTNSYLPFSFPVLKKIIVSDGAGHSYNTEYDYAKGAWDTGRREFCGFGYLRITDAEGHYTEADYGRGFPFKGRLLEQRSFDRLGNLYAKLTNAWGSEEIFSGVHFVYLKRKDNFVFNGDSTGRRTAEEFFYEETPQYGNLTKAVQLGEVDLDTGADTAGDSHTVETGYVNDTNLWLLGLPWQTVVKDNAGAIVRKSWFAYDSNTGYSSQSLTRGVLTKKEDWSGDQPGAVNPLTQYSYDDYGNLASTTDPKNKTTAITYDTQYHIFPVTTRNALGHELVNEYYGVDGVALDDGSGLAGLWGQLKSTTDPNDQQGKRCYDHFGRITAAISPLDTITFPTALSAYEFGSNFMKVTSRQRIKHGQAATMDTVQFADGLGRVIQGKKPSVLAGRYVVSGQTEYNSRGLSEKQYMPFFSENPVDAVDPIDPNRPHSTTSYDAMGRVIQTTNPDGTYSSVIYGDWITTTIDENGHMQKSYFDAYGRLIKKEEYLGADGRSPYYPAKPYTLYASTLYSYDSEGNLVNTIDAYGNTTTITYDALGRKTAMDDPDMGVWQYAYDLNGNLIQQIDAKGQTIYFTYDALNRLTNKTDQANLDVDYTYDDAMVTNSKGRLTKAAYGLGTPDTTNFYYDALGREVTSIKTMGANNYQVQRSYDALSRLDTLEYPGGDEAAYTYDPAGQITSVVGNFFVTAPPPSAPVLGAPVVSGQTISLSWNSVNGATAYKVKYGTASGSYTTTLDAGNVTSYQITNLSYSTTYYFVVVATNDVGDSAPSNEVSATTEAVPAPSAPQLNDPVMGDTTAALSWGSVTGAASYKVKYGTTQGGPYPTVLSPVTATNQTVTGLTNGTTYYFVVVASNAGGDSPNSNEKSGTPQAPSGITFGAVTSGQADSASQMNLAHTVNSGTDRVLVVAVAMKDATLFPQATAVSYAGQNLTLIDRTYHTVPYKQFGVELWYLLNPPVGANTVTAAFNTSVDGITMGVTSLNGVKQQAPEVKESALGTGSSASAELTTLTGNAWVVDSLLADSGAAITSVGSGQTQRFLQNNSSDVVGAGSTKPVSTAGSTTMLWNFSSSKAWAVVAAAFAPAPAQTALLNSSPTTIQSSGDPDNRLSGTRLSGHWGIRDKEIPNLRIPGSPSHGLPDERMTLLSKITSFVVHIYTSFLEPFFGVSEAWAQSTMDYTTFTESDPTNKVTKTADCVSYTNIETTTTKAYVYKTYTETGDFNYTFDAVVTAADTYAGPVLLWGLSPNNGAAFDDWSDGVHVAYNKIGTTFRAELAGPGIAVRWSSSLTLGQRYYFTVTRTGNTVTAKVYSNSTRSNLLSTLNVTETTQTFSYLYGFSTRTSIGTGRKATGDVCHLVDQLASPPTPPVAPSLNVPSAGNQLVNLSWSAVSGATGYKVKYGTASGSYTITLDVGNVTSKQVTGLTNGTTYYFAAVAYNAVGDSPNSNERSAAPQPPPAAPVLNDPSVGNQSVTLSWNTVSTATGYKVKYGTATGSYGTTIDVGNVTSKQITGLTNGTTYYFVVVAYNLSGDSANSNEKSAAPQPPPAAPVLNNPSAGDQSVSLTWSSVSSAAGYKVKYGTTSGSYTTTLDAGNVTTKEVTGLTNGTTYYFVVVAYNNSGDSAPSLEVSATPTAPQEFTFINNVEYNAAGQITKIEYGNGDVTQYTYHPLNLRLTRLYTVNVSGEVLQDLNYTYDSVGNILSITDNVNTAGQAFQYDELNRLTEATGGYGTKSYVYDALGNIVEKDGKTYFYGENGAGPHAVTSLSDGTTFTYDANGNMVTKTEAGVTTAYTYDAENRLVKVVKNGSTIGQYEYDGDGGRTKKTATVSGRTTTTTYVGQLFEKTSDGTRATRYVFLGGQRVAAVTNSPSLGSTTLYYHADHLGGTNVLTDATGFKKELIEYEPFGQESRHEKYGSSEEIAWYYFTGKPKDDETGLIYFGARYYDPKLGRFITADTIVPYPSDPQSFNRYSYARNNPVNIVDPTGHKWSWSKFWHAAVGALVGVAAAIVLGPAGLALVGTTMAGVIGGAVGGAITGGLEGGWKGALMGAAFGGALGGVGGWAIGGNHYWALGGMFAAGTAYAGATDSWDSYTGGFVGGIAGAAVGNGFVKTQQFQNWKAGKGFVSNTRAHRIDNLQASLGQNAATRESTNTYGKFTISVKNGGGNSGMGSSGNGWGHAWGTLEDNLGNQTSYGFWPGGEGAGKEAAFGIKYPGIVTKVPGPLDSGISSADASYTWAITQQQYNSMVSFAENFAGSWSLSVNCTDFAAGMARAGNINLQGNFKILGYSDPNKLGNILESLNR